MPCGLPLRCLDRIATPILAFEATAHSNGSEGNSRIYEKYKMRYGSRQDVDSSRQTGVRVQRSCRGLASFSYRSAEWHRASLVKLSLRLVVASSGGKIA